MFANVGMRPASTARFKVEARRALKNSRAENGGQQVPHVK